MTPLLNSTAVQPTRPRHETPRKEVNDLDEQKQPMRLTVRAVLAAKRFGKQVMERRRLRQRHDILSVA